MRAEKSISPPHDITCPRSRTYSDAFLASLAASINLEYLQAEAFTVIGQWIRIVLRILGPTLFGLMLLGLWGRVKR
jgi:hypothetical protein